MGTLLRGGLGVAMLLALGSVGVAQVPAPAVEDLKAKCRAGRAELEALVGKLTDAGKRAVVILAIGDVADLLDDGDWAECVTVVEKTLNKVK